MTVIYRIALATFMGFALTVAIASYGIAAGKTLTFHVERSSFPNWDDTDQKWSIIKLASDDLTLGVARTSSGGKAELVWKRAE
jgi:hypothetical protein